MKELFIIYLWENKLLFPELQTTGGEEIIILSPGFRNHNAGPDFLDARIRIGNTLWAGHIEVHVNASDWYRHGHHTNKAYDNVVLHLVYSADKEVYTTSRELIPCLEVKDKFDTKILLNYRAFIDSKNWIPCVNMLGGVQRFTWLAWLDRVLTERMETKTEMVLEVLGQTGNDWDETFYRRLMAGFGFKVNEAAFVKLAERLPFHLLLRHADQSVQLEALLMGQAGLLEAEFKDDYAQQLKREYIFLAGKYGLKPLDAKVWRFMRMRPVNFPTVRLAQLAAIIHKNGRLFSRILHAEAGEIAEMFAVHASAYWDTHYRFDAPGTKKVKALGKEAVNLLLINAVAQTLFAYGLKNEKQETVDRALMLLETLPAENNAIIKGFSSAGLVAVNALQSQALLELKQHYCNPRRCLDCRIGQVLLKTDPTT